jgi:hypothetical protein
MDCCFAATTALVVGPMFFGTPAWVVVFCAFIILSRIGLWMFDMAHAQILQQNVAEKEMSTVRAEKSVNCCSKLPPQLHMFVRPR